MEFADYTKESFPKSISDAASLWADMLEAYSKGVVPPSNNFEAAKISFVSIMSVSTLNDNSNWVVLFPGALSAFATQVGIGMLASGYTGTVNPISFDMEPILSLGTGGAEIEDIADRLAQDVHTWFKACRATNSNGSINWS
ncbi:MAG: hypothetical protein MUF42_15585 [Cytophagaceae bacterium]|nr:hypothetical protein [Cytophagaceae bacterium]